MKREEIADLMAFVVVAEERSFTRAAARLSMAQSALSQIVRRIEERLGLRLLTRTTRSVVPTEAGEHLLSVLGPMLHDIDSAMASLSDLQNRPSGTIRITTVEHAAKTILLPAMRTFLKSHPEIDIQLTIDQGSNFSFFNSETFHPIHDIQYVPANPDVCHQIQSSARD